MYIIMILDLRLKPVFKIQDKTNHLISSNSHPSVTQINQDTCSKNDRVPKPKRGK